MHIHLPSSSSTASTASSAPTQSAPSHELKKAPSMHFNGVKKLVTRARHRITSLGHHQHQTQPSTSSLALGISSATAAAAVPFAIPVPASSRAKHGDDHSSVHSDTPSEYSSSRTAETPATSIHENEAHAVERRQIENGPIEEGAVESEPQRKSKELPAQPEDSPETPTLATSRPEESNPAVAEADSDVSASSVQPSSVVEPVAVPLPESPALGPEEVPSPEALPELIISAPQDVPLPPFDEAELLTSPEVPPTEPVVEAHEVAEEPHVEPSVLVVPPDVAAVPPLVPSITPVHVLPTIEEMVTSTVEVPEEVPEEVQEQRRAEEVPLPLEDEAIALTEPPTEEVESPSLPSESPAVPVLPTEEVISPPPIIDGLTAPSDEVTTVPSPILSPTLPPVPPVSAATTPPTTSDAELESVSDTESYRSSIVSLEAMETKKFLPEPEPFIPSLILPSMFHPPSSVRISLSLYPSPLTWYLKRTVV
ncbi:unnamed protein product [Somion occarium]|uniref:Uncharacterized protein n=1 Tax=Somion occarium TaxID=3059160 RepID=A0ABP1E6D5_9APHY